VAKVSKKHILLVAYYWPPAGGSGVQRWLFFVKHLVSMGHKIDVLTVSHPTASPQDDTLLEHIPKQVQVHRMSIWEPGRGLYKYASGESLKPNLFSKFVRWVRANLFFPDARCLWIGKGSRWIAKFIHTHQPDWLITTGPPHSVHMMGYAYRNHPKTRWMADFRDPWVDFFVNQALPMTPWTGKRHQKWEKKIVQAARVVLTTTPSLKARYQKWNPQTEVLFNGFEKLHQGALSKDFMLCYAGSLKSHQSAEVLWQAMESVALQMPSFTQHAKVHMFGQTDPHLKNKVPHSVTEMIVWQGYQAKSVVDKALASARVLLFFGNDHPYSEQVINAKIFEYMAAGRPVLALVHSHGDLSAFIQKHTLGAVFLYSEKDKITHWLHKQYVAFSEGKPPENSLVDFTYSRKNLTSQLEKLLTQNT
jgi:glycosyltransferase involved in cell wall biosynthesis